ncbi:MAG: DAK2 domain-containing protein [Syntrophomonadaceae bacterium]|nr:DAK2 domain-containing protein [Syntrophomonadaceae bacterium]
MSLSFINGNDFVRMVKSGCIKLEHNRDSVDALNVFPVPDGDTGTNMYLTLLSAVKEGEKNCGSNLGKVSKAVSMGSLMGARGNSGVILSQVFRGMARSMEGKEQADAVDLALALRTGSETAYEAVMKPIEGTILTVIRETARACENEALKKKDVVAALMAGIQAGNATLEKTPSMLPILKEAGVVDAGGQGLLLFLEGALEGLLQDKEILLDDYRDISTSPLANKKIDAKLEIEFQYCTEVLVKGEKLDLQDIKDHLAPLGDSMLVVGDNNLVKVHIHSNHPGKVLESCLQWGSLSDIKINNMQEEIHNHINNWEENQAEQSAKPPSKIGVVAVGTGDGIIKILNSLGVDLVVEGGQTMNPSTEDLLNACQEVNAESIIILPNNSNVIMTALQVKQLYEKPVEVVPSRSVMQAITALIAFDADGDIENVATAMTEEIEQVKYAEVTYAVRDSSINGLEIKMGDVIGILCDDITVSASNLSEVLDKLLERMIDSNSQLITLVYGKDIGEDEALQQEKHIQEIYPDCEIDFHYGGQPHYSYLISVE